MIRLPIKFKAPRIVQLEKGLDMPYSEARAQWDAVRASLSLPTKPATSAPLGSHHQPKPVTFRALNRVFIRKNRGGRKTLHKN